MMDRKEEKAFPEVLKETICAYKEDPAEDKFIDLLCLLWDGIEENGSVPVPAEIILPDGGKHQVKAGEYSYEIYL